jgi:hypothetical protein
VLLGVVEMTPWVSPGCLHSVVVTCLDRPHSSDFTIVPFSSGASPSEPLTPGAWVQALILSGGLHFSPDNNAF